MSTEQPTSSKLQAAKTNNNPTVQDDILQEILKRMARVESKCEALATENDQLKKANKTKRIPDNLQKSTILKTLEAKIEELQLENDNFKGRDVNALA